MWKDYSKSYIKNNRASSISIMVAALIATFFLSLINTLAYNFWVYEIERIVLEEGDWQGRIIGEIDKDRLSLIQNFGNVEKAIVNQELYSEDGVVVDVYFKNKKTIYEDMHLILERLGFEEKSATYHELLLSRYLVHDPQDSTPPLLMTFYLGILLIISFSLILIIHNAFELSMNARIHQLGILSSIGATPKQIRTCLVQEAVMLCIVPMLIGNFIGIIVSFGLMKVINFFAADISGRHNAIFQYRPYICLFTFLIAFLTVFLSVWIPARKLSKMSILQAIRNSGGLQIKKRKNSRILYLLFGAEGELAGNALKAQKKFLRISTLSLLLSFLGFSIMLCFTTLSGISTRYTYFERYQDVWDVMMTIKDTRIENFELMEALKVTPGVRDAIVYQKAETITLVTDTWQSDELIALGGLETIAENIKEEGQFNVKSPILILDDASFLSYCSQIGVSPNLEGIILLNQIWDSVNSNFRYKKYVPFVKENRKNTVLYSTSENLIELPILSYTQKAPALREEYENYTLVYFISLSAWKKLSEQLGGTKSNVYIRILSSENVDYADLSDLEGTVARNLESAGYIIESENRIREKISNDNMQKGMVMIFGAFCVLLAVIGIANVFSNTLGFLRQRKREFAGYLSIGLTPLQMRKIFYIEASVIAGKPLLITFFLTIVVVQFMTTASYLEPMVFWREAPVVPILVFAIAITFFIALAYCIGGKRLLKCDLNETLRNDSLV